MDAMNVPSGINLFRNILSRNSNYMCKVPLTVRKNSLALS